MIELKIIEELLKEVSRLTLYNRELSNEMSRERCSSYTYQRNVIRLSKKYTRLRKAVLPILDCAYIDQYGMIKIKEAGDI